ncbi:MAG TPA: UDP-glucose 4-epimerase GalE [Leptospiraceae bacterium]|nr:UDP-glucose 4-epimerase GalE [Spirochaetaceae bacterium]HBS05027.1 UDP-glucose 4-epimerase GalE [Leptospiraceae bacterium]|tara:strand:+ start:47842 stop:48822 length:981 start_codon:yes stop_codon:yes gene_type:complete
MNILVTGGAGYIGRHTVQSLLEQGHSPVILDNLVYGHRDFLESAGVPYYIGDIADAALLRRIFREHSFDGVMHFSAFAYVGESVTKPDIYYRNNLMATVELLDQCVDSGIKTFVFSSTCATYGEATEEFISESHPQNPINPYGRSKWMVEQVLKDYEHAFGLKHVILRYFNASGAHPDGHIGEDHEPETHLIPLVLYAAMGKRPDIKIFGTDYDTPDGTCIRDYIHVCDLADAHILGLQKSLTDNVSINANLGNGSGYSVKEVIDACRKVTGKDIQAVEAPRRPGDPPRLVAMADHARQELGWNPRFADIQTIVEHAYNWHRKRHD